MRALALALAVLSLAAHASAQPYASDPALHELELAATGGASITSSTWDEVTYVSEGASMRYGYARRRLRVLADAHVLAGRLLSVDPSYETYGAVHHRFTAESVQTGLGYASRHFAIACELGALLFQVENAPPFRHRGSVIGHVRLRAGTLSRAAFELVVGTGTDGGLVDGRVYAMGLVLARERFGLRLGAGVGWRARPDLATSPGNDDGWYVWAPGRRSGRSLGLPEAVGYAGGWVRLGANVRLVFDVQGGRQLPMGRLGLRVSLGPAAVAKPCAPSQRGCSGVAQALE